MQQCRVRIFGKSEVRPWHNDIAGEAAKVHPVQDGEGATNQTATLLFKALAAKSHDLERGRAQKRDPQSNASQKTQKECSGN